jgi:hypothetical protein
VALDLPTPAELDVLEQPELDEQTAIQMAADLFVMATGLTDTPTDEFGGRMVKTAILEMAWALRTRHGDMEAEFSPFSGERIGSYTYQKASQAVLRRGTTQIKTDVPLFDSAVAYFNQKRRLAGINITSEWVFVSGYRCGDDSSRTGITPWFNKFTDPSQRWADIEWAVLDQSL